MALLLSAKHKDSKRSGVKEMGSNEATDSVSERIQSLLEQYQSSIAISGNNGSQVKFEPRKRSSVLICLFHGDDGNLRVILTLRAAAMSNFPDEVVLPGGKREEGDANDVETALREAKEEIGLDPSLVNVITVLEPITTKFGMTVVPVVGILSNKDAFTPVLNPDEVEAIFDAPLEMFIKDENRRAEEREWKGEKYLLQFFDHEVGDKKYCIWALTAGILIRAASVLYQRPPAFLELRPTFWGRSTENDMLIQQQNSKV